MKYARKKVLVAAIAAVGLGFAASGNATLLLPGSGPLPVDVLASAPGGTVLASSVTTTSTPTWTGTARTAVVQATPGGTLDYYYQVSNAASSSDALGRVTGATFNNAFTTNVFQTASAFSLFTAGSQAAMNGDRGTDGVVGFNFLPGDGGLGKIDPGQTSDTLIVRTNSTTYGPGVMGIIDGTATFVNAFQPTGQPPLVGPIPEPGTLALLASGLLATGGIARRRRV